MNEPKVRVSSAFGARNRKPFVVLSIKDVFVNLSPSEAREVGANLIEAGSAAVADAAPVEVIGGEKLSTDEVGRALARFREAREQQEEGS